MAGGTDRRNSMFKKSLKILLIGLAALFLLIQLYRIDRTNPPVVEAEALAAAVAVPADVSQILSVSCNDCHSHKTTYPWYSHVQPFAFFLEDHILEGRHHLNFSKFNTYDAQKKARKLEEICEEVTSTAMPLPTYLWIHGDAVLTPSQSKALCDWATASKQTIESGGS